MIINNDHFVGEIIFYLKVDSWTAPVVWVLIIVKKSTRDMTDRAAIFLLTVSLNTGFFPCFK